MRWNLNMTLANQPDIMQVMKVILYAYGLKLYQADDWIHCVLPYVEQERCKAAYGNIPATKGQVRSGTPIAVPLSASVTIPPPDSGAPFPIPWQSWATINLNSQNISTDDAFAVAFVNEGDYTVAPRVMVTQSPEPDIITSFTYDNNPPGGGNAGWYYFTSNSTGDSVHTYLIRAYVSFESSGVHQSVELLPANYGLSQNFPNPFNPGTMIRYDLPQSGYVTLKVYDMVGREVAALVNGFVEAGKNKEASFDGSNLPSGIYFYRLTAGSYTMTRKLVLLR